LKKEQVKREWARTIRTRQDLPVSFSLSLKEKAYFDAQELQDTQFGFAVTPYYFSLIGEDYNDPLRLQCIPREEELHTKPYEVQDPLSEEHFSPLPRLIHRYPDRVLVLLTDECALYCRHCFRRYFASRRRGALTLEQLKEIVVYLNAHEEVHELILSGGDPLTLSDEKISQVLNILRSEIDRSLIIRLASRIPVVLPERITPSLVEMLAEHTPLFVITQFNHPREITPESRSAISALVSAGLPVLNQAVLLKNVNDREDILAELFQTLLEIRVKPYYIFQGDLAAGTSHFRIALSEGFRLMRSLRRRISGLAMPVYAVDLPGGGGKIPLSENYLLHRREERHELGHEIEREGWYTFIGPDGNPYYYPDESE